MPELPEVETIRRDLAGEVEGRGIVACRIHHDDILLDGEAPEAFAARLSGRRIERLDRRAKYLIFRLEGGRILQVQLRMTGRFALGRRRPDPEEFGHLAAEIDLDDGRTLWYDDVRRLGGFRLMSDADWARAEDRLGPEPLSDGFGPSVLGEVLAGRRAPVKNLLLDQRLLAGVGNIYASESLHAAGIDPRRPGGELDRPEVERLVSAIRTVLGAALEHAGTTFRNYRAVNGRSGSFQERLAVYGRDGEACRRCGEEVRRIVQAGRSSYHCPGCQA